MLGLLDDLLDGFQHIYKLHYDIWCTGSRECPVYIRLMMQELLGLYRR